MNDKLREQIEQFAEENDLSVSIVNDDSVEFEYWSDLGEDVIFTLDLSECEDLHDVAKELRKYEMNYDIDDNYQRMGLGSLLISTLKSHLHSKGIKNMMMVCGEDNDLAISFYRKNGFKDLITTKMGHAMALEFEE